MVRQLLADAGMRRLFRHTGQMGAGKIVGVVLHLVGLALTGRALGAEAFGILMLVRGYAMAASGIAKFQSWQAIVQYGAPALQRGERQPFADLLAFAVGLDLASGIGAAILAAALIPLLGPVVGIDAPALGFAALYCLAIPTMTSAAPTGVLRILDRFDLLGVQSIVTPVVRLAGVGIAAMFGAPLWGYVVGWLLSDLVGDLYLWFCAGRELRRRRLLEGCSFHPAQAPRRTPGLWRFVLATNASASLDLTWGPLSTLAVGGVLGASAAGAYRIVLQVVDALVKPAELAARSFYPEVTRLHAGGDAQGFWTLSGRAMLLTLLLAIGFGALLALAGPAAMTAAVGSSFAEARPLLRVMAVMLLATIAAYPLESILLALGHSSRVLAARALASLCFAVLLVPAMWRFGLVGAGFAYSAAAIVLALTQLTMLVRVRRA